jgi:hypothetical protein
MRCVLSWEANHRREDYLLARFHPRPSREMLGNIRTQRGFPTSEMEKILAKVPRLGRGR